MRFQKLDLVRHHLLERLAELGVDEPLALPSPDEEEDDGVELSLTVGVLLGGVVELALPPPEP